MVATCLPGKRKCVRLHVTMRLWVGGSIHVCMSIEVTQRTDREGIPHQNVRQVKGIGETIGGKMKSSLMHRYWVGESIMIVLVG